jgi:hypothetical protein
MSLALDVGFYNKKGKKDRVKRSLALGKTPALINKRGVQAVRPTRH